MSRAAAAAMVIVVAIAFVFAPTRHFDFVNYDDLDFIVGNPHVSSGLSAANLRWAFENPYAATGGPLTWISHMMDVQMFGLNPGRHHLVSVSLHALVSVALFTVLWSATAAVGPSAIVACLFAVHPLHVESVAWISERKDVLSALFWFVTIGAYLSYVRQPGVWRYAVVALALLLGLLSKPMIATLPVILLLLDYWPLHRLPLDEPDTMRRRILEKLPLLALSLGALVLTFAAQKDVGAVASLDQIPLGTRLANAFVGVADYVRKTLTPHDLAAFYPYRDSIPPGLWIGSVILLVVLTAVAIHARRRAPYFTVGWLWFLVAVAPVSGIVQVGGHAMADRFTYIPLIGLFVIAVWGGQAVLSGTPPGRTIALFLAAAGVASSAVAARAQVWHWQNSVSLWEHAVAVTADNGRAHANLGVALAQSGDGARAIDQYQRALAIQPSDPRTHNNLGLALAARGQAAEALAHYRAAIALDPTYANAQNNLANALAESGAWEEALAHHQEAIRLEPDNALVRANFAITLGQMNRLPDGIAAMRVALRLDPRQAEWHFILGVMLTQTGQRKEALDEFAVALSIDPAHARARAAMRELGVS